MPPKLQLVITLLDVITLLVIATPNQLIDWLWQIVG